MECKPFWNASLFSNKKIISLSILLHPNRSRNSVAIWPTCCIIPWRSGEQDQQNQWWMTFQIFSLPIYRNSHPARQCFEFHGNNWINGKTWGIELPITNFTLSILTQWRTSHLLKISNLIILFNTVQTHTKKYLVLHDLINDIMCRYQTCK